MRLRAESFRRSDPSIRREQGLQARASGGLACLVMATFNSLKILVNQALPAAG